MMDDGREVLCVVSASAMGELEHVPRTPANQREEQFVRLRDASGNARPANFKRESSEGTPRGIIVRGIDLRT